MVFPWGFIVFFSIHTTQCLNPWQCSQYYFFATHSILTNMSFDDIFLGSSVRSFTFSEYLKLKVLETTIHISSDGGMFGWGFPTHWIFFQLPHLSTSLLVCCVIRLVVELTPTGLRAVCTVANWLLADDHTNMISHPKLTRPIYNTCTIHAINL